MKRCERFIKLNVNRKKKIKEPTIFWRRPQTQITPFQGGVGGHSAWVSISSIFTFWVILTKLLYALTSFIVGSVKRAPGYGPESQGPYQDLQL